MKARVFLYMVVVALVVLAVSVLPVAAASPGDNPAPVGGELTQETLVMIAGVVLSLAFSYVPGLRDWYGRQSKETKSLIMALALLLVAGAVFGLSCAGILLWVACTKAGAIGLLNLYILALMANQATFMLSPQTQKGSVGPADGSLCAGEVEDDTTYTGC